MLLKDVSSFEVYRFEVPTEYGDFGYIAGIEKVLEDLDELPVIDAVPVDTVAEMFYDFTGDSCACDFNGNDEWLSEVCELQDECPYPKDKLGCWKQYIKHYRGNCDD